MVESAAPLGSGSNPGSDGDLSAISDDLDDLLARLDADAAPAQERAA